MIRKLRKRFIRIAMLAVILVVAVLISALLIGTYTSTKSELRQTLDMLIENDGRLPFGPGGNGGGTTDGQPPETPDFSQETERDEKGKQNDGRRRVGFFGSDGVSPEMQFSTRFFTISYNADGTVLNSEWGHIAAVDDSYTDVYLAEAMDNGVGTGFIDSYIYKVTEKEDGSFLAVFLDCEKELNTIRTYVLVSLVVGVGCILLVYVLIRIFSLRAINPTIRTIEKQKQFITDASHELKTPLTVIATSQKVLEMDVGKQKWIDKTLDQVDKMRGLVEEMVVLSRLDEEREDTLYKTFNASEAVTETAESFRDFAETRGYELALEIEPDVTFTGDQMSVRRLISVLMDNAVKYAEAGGTIRMTLSATRKGIKITQENPCEPIPQEDLGRLFDRFYRVDKSRSRQTGGSGIGLSIAQGICEKHGGSIRAEAPTAGSVRFTALLNNQKVKKPAEKED